VLIVSNREPYIHMRRNERIEVAAARERLGDSARARDAGVLPEPGSPTAAATRTAKRPIRPTTSWSRPSVPHTVESGASGSPRRRSRYYYGVLEQRPVALVPYRAHTPDLSHGGLERIRHRQPRFADTVVREAKTADPIVWSRTIHFALLPRIDPGAAAEANRHHFLHIPWPNARRSGSALGARRSSTGFSAAASWGFHTQFHCNNFIDAVDHYVEARIDRKPTPYPTAETRPRYGATRSR